MKTTSKKHLKIHKSRSKNTNLKQNHNNYVKKSKVPTQNSNSISSLTLTNRKDKFKFWREKEKGTDEFKFKKAGTEFTFREESDTWKQRPRRVRSPRRRSTIPDGLLIQWQSGHEGDEFRGNCRGKREKGAEIQASSERLGWERAIWREDRRANRSSPWVRKP